MADINIVGVDLISGQFRPVNPSDFPSDNEANALQGASGLQGVTGIQGVTGVVGEVGYTGVLGPTGFRGITGTRGLTGVASLNSTGLDGVTGTSISNPGITGNTGMQGSGSYSLLNGATTITTDAYIIGLDSTGGPFTVTLPSTIVPGKIYIFQDEAGVAGTNNITLTATTPPYLSFAYQSNSYTLSFNYQAAEILNDFTVYWINDFNVGYTGLQGVSGIAVGSTGIAGATGI